MTLLPFKRISTVQFPGAHELKREESRFIVP